MTTTITGDDFQRGTYPSLAVGFDSWLTWKYIDGRKQPYSPFSDLPDYKDEGPDKWSWSHPENLTDFDTAREWARKVPGLKGLGFILQHESDPYKEPADPLVFIDLDDVVNDDGRVHPYAWGLVERTDTYADLSVSGTGIHIIGVGELPENVRTVQDDLPEHPDFPEAEIEVYDRKRFCAMTGKWLTASNRDVTDVSYWVNRLVRRFDTTEKAGESEPDHSIDVDNSVYADVEFTDNFDELKDAIDSVGRRDIRLNSTETNERNSGVIDYDPAYRNSESGAGLAWFPDNGVWCDRDGQHYMDALQLVALEEGDIDGVNKPSDYPSGEAFWVAVERLRERGANIPRYTGKDADHYGLHKKASDSADKAKRDVKKLELL